jgi:molybdopterin molybdotransferase
MLAPEEAWARIAARLAPLPVSQRPRRDCLGRWLAEPLAATVDVPFADVSAMDGYAVEGDLTAGAKLPVGATVAAGAARVPPLAPGTAARIMTGAPVPQGADRVVPVEATDGGVEAVVITEPTAAGAHVRRRGEVHRRGTVLLAPGTRLGAPGLALAAAHGHRTLAVHRDPRIALLPTGDEVVAADREPGPGQLRDTHTDFLLAALAGLGLGATPLGIARDEPGHLRHLLAAALVGHEVIVVTGGVSAGAFDHVETVLAGLGAEVLVESVAIQPGKPLVVAALAAAGVRRLVFGLPGNPGSAMVTFRLFVQPALEVLIGGPGGFWQGVRTVAARGDLPAAGPRDRFLPARLEQAGSTVEAVPLAARGSHDLAAWAAADCLLRVPAGSPPQPAGTPCEILAW